MTLLTYCYSQRSQYFQQVTADAGEDMEKEEHSSIVGGIASLYNHSGNHLTPKGVETHGLRTTVLNGYGT
jgi:metal-responsive CopG/Arc/MetJ family transcriptional regulator